MWYSIICTMPFMYSSDKKNSVKRRQISDTGENKYKYQYMTNLFYEYWI